MARKEVRDSARPSTGSGPRDRENGNSEARYLPRLGQTKEQTNVPATHERPFRPRTLR